VSTVTDVWQTLRQTEPRAVMVGPLPVTVLTRTVIVDAGDRYETGTFSWWSGAVIFDAAAVPKNAGSPLVATARAESPAVQEFLVWSRFPFWTLTPTTNGTRVTVEDMRFLTRGARFSAVTTVREGED
jgi:hypothetical protein